MITYYTKRVQKVREVSVRLTVQTVELWNVETNLISFLVRNVHRLADFDQNAIAALRIKKAN